MNGQRLQCPYPPESMEYRAWLVVGDQGEAAVRAFVDAAIQAAIVRPSTARDVLENMIAAMAPPPPSPAEIAAAVDQLRALSVTSARPAPPQRRRRHTLGY